VIGHPNDARLAISVIGKDVDTLGEFTRDGREGEDLAHLLRVSKVDVVESLEGGTKSEEIEGLVIKLDKADGDKCERCWIYSTEVGKNAEHKSLCPRCVDVVKGL